MNNIKQLLFSFKDILLIIGIFLILYLSFELGFHYYQSETDRLISPHFIDYPIVGGILITFSILSHIIIKKTKDKFFPKKIIDEDDVIDIYDKIDELSEKLHKKDKEVLESEKKYRNLFENASDLILILNENGCLVDCNKKTLLTFGISDINEFIQTPIINIIEKRKSKITQFNNIFNTVINGNLAYFEFDIYNNLTKKQSILDASFNPVTIGNHVFVQGILRDITTKKQLEEELKNSNDKYQTLYALLRSISDNIPDMLWAKNKIKKYMFANKALCTELLNCTDPEEVIGKTDLEYALKNRTKFKHDFGEMCMDSDDTVMKTLKPETFHEYGYALGKWLDLEVHKAPFFDSDNNLIGTVGVGRDITSRLKLINEVNERDERFQKLFDSASDAIIISKSGQITDVNKKAIDLFGYSKEEFCNKSVLDISSPIQYNNKIIRKVEECYDCCLDNCSDAITIWNHKKHDGTIFSAEITCNLITIKQEQYTQTILRDVSDRIAIEQKLQKSEQLYKETIDALPYMVHVVDKSHRIMLWNNKFEEFLTKYGLDIKNIKEKKLYDILNIDTPDSIKNQFDYILTTGQNSIYTHKITVNSNIFDYTVHRFPVRNGHISGVLSLLTENIKTNKKEMIVSHHEFDNLIDVVHDGAILFNYEIGNIINVNNLFLDITEYTKDELLSKNISELNIWKTFNVYGKYKEYSDIIITKNGIEKFGQLFLEIVEINYKKFGLLMIRDITFDKDIIDSYRKKLIEYNIIVDNIPIPFYCKSLDGKYTLCNNEFQKFVGKSKDEILGSTVFDIFPNTIANLYFSNEESSSIKGTYCYEHKIRNNEIYNICYNYINTDKFNGFIGTIMNISSYKLKELELLKYKELLYFIIDHIKHPIYIKDTLGNYLIVNQVFLNEFNLHDNDIRSKINEIKIFQHDILEKIQIIDKNTIRNNSYSGLNIISSNFKKITQKYINFNDDEYIIGFMY